MEIPAALAQYDNAISSLHQAGNVAELAVTLLSLASSLLRLQRPEVAATLYGAANKLNARMFGILPDRLRAVLGDTAMEPYANAGAAMDASGAVSYARAQIEAARQGLVAGVP